MLTEREAIYVISLLPLFLYILIMSVKNSEDIDESYNKYIKSQNDRRRLLHKRKRGKKWILEVLMLK